MNNTITIDVTGIHVYARHGVMPQEREVGNEFVVDLRLMYEARDAIENDELDGTINYAEAIEIVRKEMRQSSQLLEHVAGRIRNAILMRWNGICGGYVRVSKPNAPVGGQVDNVSVTIRLD